MSQQMSKYERLREILRSWGAPAYRYQQVLQAIFGQRISTFSEMTALPAALRCDLRDQFGDHILSLKPVTESCSVQANKVLFELHDGHRLETVAMRYRAGWRSYCISTQSGCGFACRFCATGAIGLKRNLSADEITDQILYFHLKGLPIDSVSLMGMGEALANLHTFGALRAFTHPRLFALSPRRVTLSTIGLPPGIRRLGRDFPQINLTFSLHSPFNEQRSQLIPLNERYPIEEVMAVLDAHIRRTRRQVTIAYLLLEGENDSDEHAAALAALLSAPGRSTRLYHLNLVRHNPTPITPRHFRRPSEAAIRRFKEGLQAHGLRVTVRPSFGSEIYAACGQLAGGYRIEEELIRIR